jgi:osmotically-inducible protein OsmY
MRQGLAAVGLALAWSLASCGTTGSQGGRTPEMVRDDKQIETDIGYMFMNDPVLRDRNFRVECYNGVVILSGRLYSEDERKRAKSLPRYVGGVKDIVDRFVVRPPD